MPRQETSLMHNRKQTEEKEATDRILSSKRGNLSASLRMPGLLALLAPQKGWQAPYLEIDDVTKAETIGLFQISLGKLQVGGNPSQAKITKYK